jgi:hypothetical protein
MFTMMVVSPTTRSRDRLYCSAARKDLFLAAAAAHELFHILGHGHNWSRSAVWNVNDDGPERGAVYVPLIP